ncbi:trypsin-like peptidase domain-containing protein [Brevibacterium sp. SMBL_HHYL_HB1]|uniref:S1C family serine protease n=1 Tax=Brevibacterium sp. SMBL_HHYL_HB1 TaxID=2777556 RepID=UPI001BA519AE|nr:trypsin-like peptidase domain-containing protein [Brevibacterium sp. SMBL_HHYL_HB1]QUL78835.1 trypsin-like peptidase domain-containing protein [Brevibacterium sp. SMBL_HHYL_HB1]
MNEPRRTRTTTSHQSARPRRTILAATGAATALALTVGGLAGLPAQARTQATAPTAGVRAEAATPFTGHPSSPNGSFGNGESSSPADGAGTPSSGATAPEEQTEATPADEQEATGVVLIDTELGYEKAEAAGTGIVLSKDGLVLTNNNVIADSTKIAVTVATTGKTYTASVVGSDSTEDVAVLQLEDAEDLQPATIDDDTVDVGDDVPAVGNSEGGGRLMAAEGTVTDLGASVTTTDKGTEDSETLDDMIEVQADIVSGDSGRALLDDEGEVVGMDTAASSGTAVVTGFAIPIETALTTAESIIDGEQTSTNTLGYPAFLGIGVSQSGQADQSGQSGQSGRLGRSGVNGESGRSGAATTEGAVVAGVYEDTPAAEAGLAAGDTITAIGSTPITDGNSLSEAMSDHEPGDTVSLTWTDANGQSHTTEVTLTQGPAA